MVQKIVIHTSAPTFDQLDRRICDRIDHGPPGKQEPFAKVLFGCWDQLVEAHLREDKRTKITWQALQSLLHEISIQFQEDNLPTEFIGMLQNAFPSLSDDNRTFMRQLLAIGATERQRERAQRHYLRSTQLLGFWQRHILVRPDEVLKHSKRLVEECELRHENAKAKPDLVDASAQEFGRQIYHWAIEMAPHEEAFRIRPRCIDLDVIRGCFHRLADGPQLGWHPDWPTMFASSTSGG